MRISSGVCLNLTNEELTFSKMLDDDFEVLYFVVYALEISKEGFQFGEKDFAECFLILEEEFHYEDKE